MIERILIGIVLWASVTWAIEPIAAADPPGPSTESLIKTIRTGDKKARTDAIHQLSRRESLEKDERRALFAIYQDAELPVEAREDALMALMDICGTPLEFLKPLLAIARNPKEPSDVRGLAVISLQLIVRILDDSPVMDFARGFVGETKVNLPAEQIVCCECMRVICEIANDTQAPADLRKAALGAMVQSPDRTGQADGILQAVIANRAEATDVRESALKMVSVSSHYFARTEAAEYARLVLSVASDKSEPTSLRLEALDSLWQIYWGRDSISFIVKENVWQALLRKINEAEIWTSAPGFSRALIVLLCDTSEDRRVRDKAGSALQVLPVLDSELAWQLSGLLLSGERWTHYDAVGALENIGIAARSESPALVAVWSDQSQPPDTRAAAARAILKVDPARAAQLGIGRESTIVK